MTAPGAERAHCRRLGVPAQGGRIAVIEREGAGGTLIFAHANGLSASAYHPMMDALRLRQRLFFFDARGHGRTTLPADPARLRDWRPYAEDVAFLAARAEGPLILAGHSMGAVSVLLAAAAGVKAAAVILIEPVILPKTARLIARTPALRRSLLRAGIAAKAARRRAEWPDRGAAEAHMRKSRFFSAWHEEAFKGYLEDGIVEAAGLARLACDPSWEAATFAAQAHGFWRPLETVRAAGVPVFALKATGWSTVPDWAMPRLERAGVHLTVVEGDHVLPQTDPAMAADFVSRGVAAV